MKILYLMFGTRTGIGGIESLMPHLLENSIELGIDAHLIAQFIPNSYSKKIFDGRIHEVTIPGMKSGIYMKLPKIFRYLAYIPHFYSIINVVREVRPDIIHSQDFILSVYALCLKKIYNIPYIHTFHSSLHLENYLPHHSLKNIMKILWKNNIVFKNADWLTAVSPVLREETEKLINSPVTYIPNGIDSEYFSGDTKQSHNKKPILLTVSRLSPVKAIKDVISAMPHILTAIPEAKLVIVGDGEQREELEACVSSLNIRDSVIFIGAIPNKGTKKYYQEAKIFLMPSESEGLPIALLESMSCGLPFIATPVSIVPEVYNGKNGVIVPVHDVEKIAEASIRLLSLSDVDYDSIAQTNHMIASNYSWENACKQYLEIYNTTISKQT